MQSPDALVTDTDVRPPSSHIASDDHAPAPYQRAYGVLTGWAATSFAVILGFSRLSYGLLLPALRANLHGSYTVFGRVGTANLAGYLVGTLLVPFLAARARDRIRLNTLAIIAMSLAMIASATSVTVTQLGVWRLLVGIASAPATVLTITLTFERIAPAERGRASGMIWMGGAAGIVASGLVAPFVVGTGASPMWRLVWAAMGGVGIVAAFGLRRTLRASPVPGAANETGSVAPRCDTPDTESEKDQRLDGQGHGGRTSAAVPTGWGATLANLMRPRGLLALTLAYAAFGGGYIIYFTFFIALVQRQGLPSVFAGLVWSALGLAGAVGGLLWGRAIDRRPTGFTLAAALALSAVGALGVTGIAADGIGALLIGSASIGVPTMFTALLQRAVPAARYTASLSLITAALALGQMLGPLVGGAVADAHGLKVATASAAVSLALAALLAAVYGSIQRTRT